MASTLTSIRTSIIRWSQATERVIGSGGVLDVKRQPTLLFNGYADEVASLYRGLNLREYY